MGQYEPNGIGEMRKKKKEIWKPSECCAVYTRTYHIWCTHIGALWMGFSVWFVFRKMPGKRKRNYPHNTTNRVRCMRNANVLLFSVFMCGFFFCADLERELDSRPRMPRHNRHNLARANETHALHEYMYIGEAGGAVVYLVWAWQLVNHDDVCTTAIRTAATISAQYTPSAFYPEQVQVPLTPVRRPGTRLRRRCSLFTYDCRLYV